MTLSTKITECLHSEFYMTIFVLLCSLVSFWPLVVGYHTTKLESSTLRASLDDVLLERQTSAVALALLIPLILDWLADMRGPWFGGAKKHADSIPAMGDVQKGCLFLGLAIVPCLAYISPDYNSLGLLWFCLSRFQIVIVLGTLHISFSRSAVRHDGWPWWSKLLAILMVTTGVNITAWTSIEGILHGPIPTLATALKTIALFLVVIPSGRWLVRAGWKLFHKVGKRIKPLPPVNVSGSRRESISSSSINPQNTFAEETLFFPALFIMIGTACYAIVLIMLIVLGSASQFTTEDLMTYKAAFIIVEVGLLFYYMRKIKYESLYNLCALIEARKQYLRYIAHEMRTPLNSAVLGLKLICDSFATIENKDDFDNELCDTANDVSKTLSIAVQILNDLMTFNKIEGGLMKLHKQSINVQEHIQDVVDTIAAEARQKEIKVEVKNYIVKKPVINSHITHHITGHRTSVFGSVMMMGNGTRRKSFKSSYNESAGNVGSHLMVDLDDVVAMSTEDTVFADKFKMDQVLRNLLSNALKFSPRGSVVTVRVGFQPCKEIEPQLTKESIHIPTPNFLNGIFQCFIPSKRDVDDKSLPQLNQGPNQVVEAHSIRSGRGVIQGELIVMVTDAGVGISKENQEQLFQDGMQFNPEILQTGGGSGFGLFISKSIVQLHGGTIQAFSEGEGKGCTFVYKIPMTKFNNMQTDPSLHFGRDEKMDVEEIRPTAIPLPIFSGIVDNNDITPVSRSGSRRIRNQHRSSVVSANISANSHDSRLIAARKLSNYRLQLQPSFQSQLQLQPQQNEGRGRPLSFSNLSSPHIAESGVISKDESFEGDLQRVENNAINSETSSTQAQQALLENPFDISGTSTTFRGTTKAVTPTLQSIIEDPNNNSPNVSDRKSIDDIPVLPPSTIPDSNHESVSPCPQPLSLLFGTNNDMAGGGGVGAVSMPKSVNPNIMEGPLPSFGMQMGSEVVDGQNVQNIVGVNKHIPSVRKLRIMKESQRELSASRLFHILVVDDSPMSRKMLRRTLVAAGHTCEEAEDGSIAVEMINKQGLVIYDAILMDFVMPVMDGPDATKAIRTLGYTGPIIGCTGNTLDMDLERFKESGCDRVIGKPFQLELFHQYMEELAIRPQKSEELPKIIKS